MDPFRILSIYTTYDQVSTREGQYTSGCLIQEQESGLDTISNYSIKRAEDARAYSGHQVFHCTHRRDSALEGSTDKRSGDLGHDAPDYETAKKDAKL